MLIKILHQTLGLTQLVEHHYIMWIFKAFGEAGHILPSESVGTVHRLLLTVRPVHTILNDRKENAATMFIVL